MPEGVLVLDDPPKGNPPAVELEGWVIPKPDPALGAEGVVVNPKPVLVAVEGAVV